MQDTEIKIELQMHFKIKKPKDQLAALCAVYDYLNNLVYDSEWRTDPGPGDRLEMPERTIKKVYILGPSQEGKADGCEEIANLKERLEVTQENYDLIIKATNEALLDFQERLEVAEKTIKEKIEEYLK